MSKQQDERIAILEDALAYLNKRVTLLEQQAETAVSVPLPPNSGEIDFALLDRLYARDGIPYEADGVKGAILYAIAFQSAQNKLVRWYAESAAPSVLSYDEQMVTQIIVALGHPVRLQIVRLLIKEGATDSQTMQTAVGIQSAGQLYFHLNNLLEAGIVVQLRRGVYEIEIGATAQLLALFAAAVDLAQKIPDGSSEK